MSIIWLSKSDSCFDSSSTCNVNFDVSTSSSATFWLQVAAICSLTPADNCGIKRKNASTAAGGSEERVETITSGDKEGGKFEEDELEESFSRI